jgi:putative membrane protein insertion efficiency factor
VGKIIDITKQFLILIIKIYQYFVSPLIGKQCRFYPSCSCYAIDALKSFGLFYSSYLILYRLLRCHPWCKGGLDSLPERKNHANQNS